MSWDVLITSDGDGSKPIGRYDRVRALLDERFPGMQWLNDIQCGFLDGGGFLLTLLLRGEVVAQMSTQGGYNHLPQFAALCRQQGWQLIDMQFGEPMDLDRPYARYETKE